MNEQAVKQAVKIFIEQATKPETETEEATAAMWTIYEIYDCNKTSEEKKEKAKEAATEAAAATFYKDTGKAYYNSNQPEKAQQHLIKSIEFLQKAKEKAKKLEQDK